MLWASQPGALLASLRLHLVDTSQGMIDKAREALVRTAASFTLQVASIEELPFPSGYFDVAVANHMLYHVEDLPRGIAEVARVLKPGGVLYASTNGANHMGELQTWMREARLPTWHFMQGIVRRFGLENGAALLGTRFPEIKLYRHDESLLVPEIRPVLDYAESIFNAQAGPTSQGMQALASVLEMELRSRGVLTIALESGFFECRGHVPTGGVT